MSSTEPEQAHDPGRELSQAAAKVESGKMRTLVGVVMLVIFVAVVVFGGGGPVDPVKLAVPVIVLILGFYHVIGGLLQTRTYKLEVARLTAASAGSQDT